MPVWFVYRSFDMGPTGKFLRRFEDDTILGWFQRHWDHLAIRDWDEAQERLEEVVGCNGWCFWNPFWASAEESLPPPKSHAELMSRLNGYLEGVISHSPHDLQVWTEEDGEGGVVYYFDGHFLEQSGDLAAYLLHEDWRLPSGHASGTFVPAVETIPLEPGGEGPGTTYLAMLIRESKYPLDDLPVGYRIEGLRLPELSRHLLSRTSELAGWHGLILQLPALLLAGVEAVEPMERAFLQAIQANPGDPANWAAWSDWREERGASPPGIDLLRRAFERLSRFPGDLHLKVPREANLEADCRQLLKLEEEHRARLRTAPHSLLHVEDHLAQMCLDVSSSDEPYFDQWIFFDDLWASAHPDLANGILRFSSRWEVLSPD